MKQEGGMERTHRLIEVAQGREKAHLAVVHATLANVYSGELLENQAVCVWDRRIAYVGPHPDPAIGPDTVIIDAGGKPLIPGLIDGHTHLAVMHSAGAFLASAIPGGTTAVVTETTEPYAVRGYAGIVDFMDSFADQPIHVFGTAPPMISISPNCPPIAVADLHRLISRNDIIGLGESYWQMVLRNPEQMLPILDAVMSAGKRLEGHSAGARDAALNAYAAAGISSCHEPIAADEALDRLRLGFYVMIREGSIRRDLTKISALRKTASDLRRLILVTDGVSPHELLEKGYMEYVVQKAIDAGFTFMEAVQMATLNPATHFNLDHMIGGIAPGRYADMAILPNIRTIRPELVICKGRIIARDGRCMVSPRAHRYQPESLDTVHLPDPLTAADFRISASHGDQQTTVRVIDMVTDLVSRESHVTLPVIKGEIKADVTRDIVKVAAVNRTHRAGQRFVGMIRGFGINAGAVACSTGWDTAGIVAVGASDGDMAVAINRLHDLKGGVVVCRDGGVVAELALPVFGLMSHLPIGGLTESIDAVNTSTHALGVKFRDPIQTLSTLTSAAIPFLRICEEGLVNLKNGPCTLVVSPC
ncbi:Ade: adenine deaminase [Desulfococcus multivorans]|nr:Ade: adenine deaminase [Desulfococcus multivorans]